MAFSYGARRVVRLYGAHPLVMATFSFLLDMIKTPGKKVEVLPDTEGPVTSVVTILSGSDTFGSVSN